jgi:hypothetical protein
VNETFKIAMAGLPDAGKSTYLVALYIAMTEKQSALTLSGYSDDREYMNDLSSRIYAAKKLGRTRADNKASLSLSVTTPSGRVGRLQVPDRSGEVWEQLVIDRVWDDALLASIVESIGFCVFINAETFRHDPELRGFALLDDVYPPSDSDYTGTEATVHPEQVKVTDLVQILEGRPEHQSVRVSLILSAFDTVSDLTPQQWLSENIPLLDQYLRTNSSKLQTQVFGVSAQGGNFDDATDLAAIEDIEPHQRAWAAHADGTRCSIDVPMLWALAEL